MPLEAPPFSLYRRTQTIVPGLIDAFVLRVNRVPSVVRYNSWWRSVAENFRVSGDRNSQHLWACAVDVNGDLAAIEREARNVGLVVVRLSGRNGPYIHLQAWPAGVAAKFGLPQKLGVLVF